MFDPFGDETYAIVLNSTASEADTPSPLRELFRYMNDAIVPEGIEEGRAEGIQEGRAEGLQEGALNTLADLVRKGLLTEEVAAQQAGISLEDFRALLRDPE